MADDVGIRFVGLKEFKGALRQIDSSLPNELKIGYRAIAESVAAVARGGVPRRTGRAAASIKARGSQRGGAIAFGGSAAPYYPWLDFGGSTGRGHKSGVAWSGAIKRDWMGAPGGEGRYVYPAIRSQKDDIERQTEDMVERLAHRAGFDTKEGLL